MIRDPARSVSAFPGIPLSASLLVLLLGLTLFVGCMGDEPATEPIPVQTFPSSEATNATTVFLSGSVVTTRIQSGHVVSFADRDSSWAFGLLVDFYDSTGAHTSNLRADSALIRETQRHLDVFGSVQVKADKGTTLDSEHLAWNDSSRTISTDSLVRITRGEDIMMGYGFQSDPDLTRIILRKHVSGQIADPEALKGDSGSDSTLDL